MMPAQSPERIRRGLERRTGLRVRVDPRSGGAEFLVSPTEFDPRESFTVLLRLGYQRVEAEFHLGAFAAVLLEEMSRSTPGERMAFRALARAVREGGGSVDLEISGRQYPAEAPSDWPTAWSGFGFKVTRAALDISGMTPDERDGQLEHWGALALLIGMALAARAEEDDIPAPEPGLPEGAKMTVTVNRYERSRRNRAHCLAIHGCQCVVCGLDFGEAYGELGEGFIHVHHITPVSEIGADYSVDPTHDLVPVCPNCHAMLHRRSPPVPPDHLRSMIRASRGPGDGGTA